MKRYAELTGNRKKHGIKSPRGNKLDYRGEIIVAIHNDSLPIDYYPTEKTIHKGDRIAQLVIQPYMPAVLQEVEELTDTPRGEGGFGSTGKSGIPANTNTGYDYEQITLYDIINKE